MRGSGDGKRRQPIRCHPHKPWLGNTQLQFPSRAHRPPSGIPHRLFPVIPTCQEYDYGEGRGGEKPLGTGPGVVTSVSVCSRFHRALSGQVDAEAASADALVA